MIKESWNLTGQYNWPNPTKTSSLKSYLILMAISMQKT